MDQSTAEVIAESLSWLVAIAVFYFGWKIGGGGS